MIWTYVMDDGEVVELYPLLEDVNILMEGMDRLIWMCDAIEEGIWY